MDVTNYKFFSMTLLQGGGELSSPLLAVGDDDAVVVLVLVRGNHDDIDERPDAAAAEGEEHEHACPDFSRVETVDAVDADDAR